jgi:hypothetical protein
LKQNAAARSAAASILKDFPLFPETPIAATCPSRCVTDPSELKLVKAAACCVAPACLAVPTGTRSLSTSLWGKITVMYILSAMLGFAAAIGQILARIVSLGFVRVADIWIAMGHLSGYTLVAITAYTTDKDLLFPYLVLLISTMVHAVHVVIRIILRLWRRWAKRQIRRRLRKARQRLKRRLVRKLSMTARLIDQNYQALSPVI